MEDANTWWRERRAALAEAFEQGDQQSVTEHLEAMLREIRPSQHSRDFGIVEARELLGKAVVAARNGSLEPARGMYEGANPALP